MLVSQANRRAFIIGLGGVATLILQGAENAAAQVYPSHPITMIVPFPPGGASDNLARILAERMHTWLGQPVIIENVSGAGASIGVVRLARSPPDGYTIGIGNMTSHVGAPAIYPIAFNVLADLEPVSLLSFAPLWIIGKIALPPTSAWELIAWLRANSDKATFGTVGIGSPAHLGGVYLQANAGMRFSLIPYRGAAPAIQDLIAGQIDLACLEASSSLPFVQSGKIKAYMVLGKTRWAAAPEVPTTDETGVSGLDISFWHGLWVPKETPKEAVAKVNAAVVDALANPAVRERLTNMGHDIATREQQTPEALRAFHTAEIEKWSPIIKAAGIRAE